MTDATATGAPIPERSKASCSVTHHQTYVGAGNSVGVDDTVSAGAASVYVENCLVRGVVFTPVPY